MSNKENQNENLNKFYDTLDNVIKTGRADGKENKETKESEQQTLATTTVGTGAAVSNSNMQYGWICPRCGKVLAPWKDSCDCYLNVPYTPPNTPAPTPFNPMPSWPKAPEIGDAPGWWQYGPKCGEPIFCDGNVSSGGTTPKLQIYNTELKSSANTDSPDIAAIKSMSEVVNDSISVPLKDLDRVLNDKLNLKTTKKI